MKKIVIYGASDDLVEIEDLTPHVHPPALTEEAGAQCDEPSFVIVTTGTGVDVFEVEYTSERPDGLWRVRHKVVSGALAVSIATPPETEDAEDYTDRATLEGFITRVDIVSHWPLSTQRMRAELDDVDWSDVCDALTDDEVRRITEIVTGLTIDAGTVVP